MNLSFAGCGFLGIYHVGVAVCFKKYAPHLLLGKISGASFGALSACCLLCDLPIGEITTDVLRVVSEARAGSLGPFSPSFNIQNVLLEGMQKYLPHDVHKIVSGKLHISLTRVYDGKNVIVSEFPTREDLLQALLASCFVPVFSGLLPPRFHGIRYMDGGFSDNLPVLDENTITVSPFCGESDICPRDLSSQLFHVNLANTSIELSKQNMNRFARILFPPKPEVLSNMCKQGFDDALRFLQRNNMISCTRCLAVQSTFQLQDVLDDTTYEYDPDCEECKTHRQDALVDDLPDTVMTIFQNAIDSANSGIVNWVMRQRAMRYLTLLTLPYRVPIDIMYASFTKFVTCTPKMSKSLWKLSLNMLQQLHGFMYATHDRSEAAARIYYKLTMDNKTDATDGRQLDRRFDEKESISGVQQLKSSVQKGIRARLLELYPHLDNYIDQVLPKKDTFRIVKCHDHIEIMVNSAGELLFFRQREGPWMPTLKLLHKYPFFLPMQQVDKGAIRFVLSGANIMCPGLTSPGARMSSVDKGQVVAVMAEGKEHALAVGCTALSTDDIAKVNKGVGIENCHYLNDGLWQMKPVK